MKIIRGWDEEKCGPKPYSEEWWLRLDARNALRANALRAVERQGAEG